MKYLITGCAGFIGFHVSLKLLNLGQNVIGVDNLNSYYDVKLKKSRLKILLKNPNFIFYKVDISNYKKFNEVFKKHKIDKICHLAAQAGVRYSIENPFLYEKCNCLGFLNILELSKKYKVNDLVFASSSSVYGNTNNIPFNEEMTIDKPNSLYAATKAANELYSYVYHYNFGINIVGLRFFTVYGPWGRPDMAYFIFSDALLKNKPIKIYNYGKMSRDFTFIDDIVDGVIKALEMASKIKYGIFNLGNSNPNTILDLVNILENEFGKKVKKELLPLPKGDVKTTFANINKSKTILGFEAKTDLKTGIKEFVKWYKKFYKIE